MEITKQQDLQLMCKVLGTMVCVYADAPTKPGDEVIIEFTDGLEGYYQIGRLDSISDDGPECVLDGKSVDLAGEGHSSRMFKVIGKFEIGTFDRMLLGL